MGAFEYVALDKAGKESKGLIEGDTAKHVRQEGTNLLGCRRDPCAATGEEVPVQRVDPLRFDPQRSAKP